MICQFSRGKPALIPNACKHGRFCDAYGYGRWYFSRVATQPLTPSMGGVGGLGAGCCISFCMVLQQGAVFHFAWCFSRVLNIILHGASVPGSLICALQQQQCRAHSNLAGAFGRNHQSGVSQAGLPVYRATGCGVSQTSKQSA